MNYKYFLYAILILISSINAKQLKGLIKLPSATKNIPNFSVMYMGTQTTSDSDGIISLPYKQDNFSILVTRATQNNLDKKNTLKNLSFNNQKPYKYFKSITNVNGLTKWKEYLLKTNDIPENTIVIHMNPKLVDKLEEWKVKLPSGFSNLPKIVLKKNTTNNALLKSSNKSLLYSLNQAGLHQAISRTQKSHKNFKKIIQMES